MSSDLVKLGILHAQAPTPQRKDHYEPRNRNGIAPDAAAEHDAARAGLIDESLILPHDPTHPSH